MEFEIDEDDEDALILTSQPYETVMNIDKSYLGSIDCIYSLIMNLVFVTFTENLLLSYKRIFIILTICTIDK